MAEALSRTLWHHSHPPATLGPWAGSRSPTLRSPPRPPASRQDTQTRATVFTAGAPAASTARVSDEEEDRGGPLSSHHAFCLIDAIIRLNMQHDILPNRSVCLMIMSAFMASWAGSWRCIAY